MFVVRLSHCSTAVFQWASSAMPSLFSPSSRLSVTTLPCVVSSPGWWPARRSSWASAFWLWVKHIITSGSPCACGFNECWISFILWETQVFFFCPAAPSVQPWLLWRIRFEGNCRKRNYFCQSNNRKCYYAIVSGVAPRHLFKVSSGCHSKKRQNVSYDSFRRPPPPPHVWLPLFFTLLCVFDTFIWCNVFFSLSGAVLSLIMMVVIRYITKVLVWILTILVIIGSIGNS